MAKVWLAARLSLSLLVAGFLLGCAPEPPVRIGFLGGVSGRVADLGIGGRNGVQLAIDMRNAAGGVRGRKIELLVEDDKQDPEVAKHAMGRLIGQRVAAIVGPMTSAIAVSVVPRLTEAGMLMISPTVTTNSLSGKDDNFLRVTSSTRSYAKVSAEYLFTHRGARRIAAIYDTRNRAYTEDWLTDYRKAFTALGGEVIAAIEFASSDDLHFAELARQLLDKRPDSILILSNSVDAAMFLQQIRKQNRDIVISGSEWAATERLTELAGKAAEGFIAAQFFDRQSQKPAYVAFRKAYLERFGIEPGFAGANGFDAANALLDALEKKPENLSLKQALLSSRFDGVQSEIVFDDFGDVSRPTYITTVKNGQFAVAK